MTLRIGDIAPDFTALSTRGPLQLHAVAKDRWTVLFSHPKDFTPVCTTELGALARMQDQFESRGVVLIGVSVDAVTDHQRWLADVERVAGAPVRYPLLGDEGLSVAKLYGMLPAEAEPGVRTPADNATVRTVFVIGPDLRIRAFIAYPMSNGRNFAEIIRLLDALQLTATHGLATPADWTPGQDVIIPPAIKDEEARARFGSWEAPTSYLRFVPAPK